MTQTEVCEAVPFSYSYASVCVCPINDRIAIGVVELQIFEIKFTLVTAY